MIREWTLPILIAATASLGAYWGVPLLPDPFDQGPHHQVASEYVLLPEPGSLGHSTLLRFDATPRHTIGHYMDLHAGSSNGTHWTWDGRDGFCLMGGDCTPQGDSSIMLGNTSANAPHDAAPGDPSGKVPVQSMPLDPASTDPGSTQRVGPGNETLIVTFYAFDEAGYLLATNAPAEVWRTFDRHGDFVAFEDRAWYVGPDPPHGVRALPIYQDEAWQLLNGTRVGSVQSAVLEDHEHGWYFGAVWVTVRVEGIA